MAENLSLKSILGADHAALKEQRVERACASLELESRAIVDANQAVVNQIKEKIAKLLDLGEYNTQAIAQRLETIDSKKLMNEYYELVVELDAREYNLELIKKHHNALFPAEGANA